jgi:hypothetical protein
MTDAPILEQDVAVTERDSAGLLDRVFDSFSERGYELGYRRAVSEMTALLLLAAAEHRREGDADLRARAAVERFVERLDWELQHLIPGRSDVLSGGLGI